MFPRVADLVAAAEQHPRRSGSGTCNAGRATASVSTAHSGVSKPTEAWSTQRRSQRSVVHLEGVVGDVEAPVSVASHRDEGYIHRVIRVVLLSDLQSA
jgi:hypothetical protein